MIRDLLSPAMQTQSKHNIVHNRDGSTTVTDAVVQQIRVPADVYRCLENADNRRAIGATQCNEHSSRSHSVFSLNLHGVDAETGRTSLGVLHLVDLAGSERLASSKAEGQRLKVKTSATLLKSVIYNWIKTGDTTHQQITLVSG
jgi:kinesin family protein C1